MSDMNVEELEKKLRSIRLKTSPELDARMQELFRRTAQDSGAETSASEPGRPSTRRRWTLAARSLAKLRRVYPVAAAICLLAFVGWVLLGRNGGMDSAYAELDRALENSRTEEWVHIVVEKEGAEEWYLYRPGQTRHFAKDDGRIVIRDYQTYLKHVYEPAERTITISDFRPGPSYREAESFYEMLMFQLEIEKAEGAAIEKTDEAIDGKSYTAFTITRNAAPHALRWLVDPKLLRLVRVEHIPLDPTQAGAGMLVIDVNYPAEGPADIYALGAPRDAKIVDLTPPQKVVELRQKVDAARESFAPTYYAIVYKAMIDAKGRHNPEAPYVVYKKDGRYRIERYHTVPPGEFLPSGDELLRRIPADDMGALEAWTKSRRIWELYYYEPPLTTEVSLDDSGQLEVECSHLSGAWNFLVEEQVWGTASVHQGSTFAALPEEAGPFGRLVGAQGTWQGRIFRGGSDIILPGRARWYFNPARDYVRERYERVSDANAPWQEDEGWLKDFTGDPAKKDYRRYTYEEVLECEQTAQGQWYAKKILTKSEGVYSPSQRITIIHLDTTRSISDDLLDPNNTESPHIFELDRRQRAFNEAIKIIDSRENWPATPEEVAKWYWEARNARDYEEMAVLWPGSASWARELAENEKRLRYVFGEAKELPSSEVLVPYAWEGYYEKHGSYNLKMVLTNERSSKGRYYIVSGN